MPLGHWLAAIHLTCLQQLSSAGLHIQHLVSQWLIWGCKECPHQGLSSVYLRRREGEVLLHQLLLQYKAHPTTKSASRLREGLPAKSSCWQIRGRCGSCGQGDGVKAAMAGRGKQSVALSLRCVTAFSLLLPEVCVAGFCNPYTFNLLCLFVVFAWDNQTQAYRL